MAQANIDARQSLSNQAVEYIENQVNNAAQNIFEKQTCVTSHQITHYKDKLD